MADENQAQNNTSHSSTWYEDRYQSLLIQRNLFFIIIVICIALIVVSVVMVGVISNKKEVQPMVIQVEDTTGITNIVNPDSNREWTVNETMNKYFIYKYITARETYNVSTYEYNYNTVVRLMSSSQVYSNFATTLSNQNTSPVIKYGANINTTLAIRSILFVNSSVGQSVQIRITITPSNNAPAQRKTLYMTWSYNAINLTFNERMVNPLGFQVLAYSITDDLNA